MEVDCAARRASAAAQPTTPVDCGPRHLRHTADTVESNEAWGKKVFVVDVVVSTILFFNMKLLHGMVYSVDTKFN